MKKKLLLGLFFGIALMTGVSMTYAQSDVSGDVSSKVFKLQAYSYNKLFDMYSLKQYGSAVLIAPNILLTNAHVITDDNDNLTLQYEACQTISTQDPPTCFSSLQLLSYDKDNDLALLQIKNPSDNMPDPVVLGSGTLAVGDAIHIIGYPVNGGDTITTTQGTIAGFDNGYYKTDANVDEGNSGGGGFDSGDNFIGIPTFVVNGQTTLGYVIPISVIKDFIAGKSGITYPGKTPVNFDNRLKSIYAIKDQGIISNNLFTTPDFSGAGLSLTDSLEKANNNLYNYVLQNENGSQVQIVSLIATDNAAISKYINSSMKEFSASGLSPKRSTKRIGTMTRNTIVFGNTDRIEYEYIQANSTNKSYMEYAIVVDKSNASDLSGLVNFVENIIMKKIPPKPQVLNIPLIKLSSKRNIGIAKRIKDDGLSIGVFPADESFTMEVSAYPAEQGDTLKTVTSQINDIYDAAGSTVTTGQSKYPNSVSISSVVDENNKKALSIRGIKNYGGNNIFINFSVYLKLSAAKQNAINLVYKILGLQ